MNKEETSLEQKVTKWLGTQGYPLEIRSASALRKADYLVTQSQYYFDSKAEKPREVDVVAEWSETITDRRTLTLSLALECKHSHLPWVIFTSPESAPVKHPFSLLAWSWTARHFDFVSKLCAKVDGHHSDFLDGIGAHGYGVTTAKLGKHNEEKEERKVDPAWAACCGIATAAHYLSQIDYSFTGFVETKLIIPIVLVQGDLFTCQEADGQLVVERTSSAVLRWPALGTDQRSTKIQIITPEELPVYAAAAKEAFQKLVSPAKEIAQMLASQTNHVDPPMLSW